MKSKIEKTEYKFISFLNSKSLENFNKIAKKFGIKYKAARVKKPIEEKINYDKLMRQGSRSRI